VLLKQHRVDVYRIAHFVFTSFAFSSTSVLLFFLLNTIETNLILYLKPDCQERSHNSPVKRTKCGNRGQHKLPVAYHHSCCSLGVFQLQRAVCGLPYSTIAFADSTGKNRRRVLSHGNHLKLNHEIS
jgi:hypothetical protein